MPRHPGIALKVNDLATSLAFYTVYIGCTQVDEQNDPDKALILDEDGDLILLASLDIAEIKRHLDEPRIVSKPGDTLTFPDSDIDARYALLISRGLTGIQQEANAEGDRKLIIKAPDDYTIVYSMPVKLTPEEIISRYARGSEEIENTLAGLNDADLYLSQAPGEWSIRQIVNHLTESDSLFLMTIKTALAQSGSIFIRPPYDQACWVEELHYQERAIEPSIALIKAIRLHILQLLESIPNHWEHYVMMKFLNEEGAGYKTTVGDMLDICVRHLAEHCEEIRETRRVHNL